MKNFQKTTYVIMLAFVALMASCSSDDGGNGNPNEPNDPSVQLGNAGDPHAYDINITGGDFEQRHLVGEIENKLIVTDLALLECSTYNNDGNLKSISFTLTISAVDSPFATLSGHFYFKDGDTKDLGDPYNFDEKKSSLIMQFFSNANRYASKSGSVNLSNVAFTDVGMPDDQVLYDGFAAYDVSFDGTFFEIFGDDEDVNISGSFALNFPEEANPN